MAWMSSFLVFKQQLEFYEFPKFVRKWKHKIIKLNNRELEDNTMKQNFIDKALTLKFIQNFIAVGYAKKSK